MSWHEKLIDHAKDKEVARKIVSALEALLDSDAYLLKADANERSISHRLAVHLDNAFEGEGWDIDCEYNRDGHDPKKPRLRDVLHPKCSILRRRKWSLS
jgi:hypothetical protein